MTTIFRDSKFIDFNTGIVKANPMMWQKLLPGVDPSKRVEYKIGLFHCRVDVWQLGVAVQILREIESPSSKNSIWCHAAYGMLAITFSYFEMIGKILNPASGKFKTARMDFNYGFCDVYPEYKHPSGSYKDSDMPAVKEFRDRVRNGMYHLAYTKHNLFIHNDPENISKRDFDVIQSGSSKIYYLNPHSMVRTIVAHFPGFIERLNNPDPQYDVLRDKFVEFFDKFHSPGS